MRSNNHNNDNNIANNSKNDVNSKDNNSTIKGGSHRAEKSRKVQMMIEWQEKSRAGAGAGPGRAGAEKK